SAIGVAVIAAYAVLGLDPLTHLLFWFGTTGGFGILLLLALTSVAVIGYFAGRRTENVWRSYLAPALAAVALAAMIVLAVANFATLLGVEPASPVQWILPGSYAVAAAIGLARALMLRATRPDVYARIGLGANA